MTKKDLLNELRKMGVDPKPICRAEMSLYVDVNSTKIFIVHEYSNGDGIDLFVPICEENNLIEFLDRIKQHFQVRRIKP